ncbi:MAG: Fic family protein [Gemmataceae bacterium]|nr:Fic family protein [Gemmataceae bacterium]
MSSHKWASITDLPDDISGLASNELPALVQVWHEQSDRLKQSEAYRDFLDRLRRQLAIETGIIERLYNIDRGVTQLLIEKGIDEVYVPHGTTDRPAAEVIAMIRDHESAIEGMFAYIASRTPLTKAYLRELHKVLTAHQHHVEAVNMEGQPITVTLLRGEWKKWPNNPTRRNSSWLHEYCPPEHVESEINNMIEWHRFHEGKGVPPEVEAAWLHHRFTQIHPFQDGNGRVARCLATLVFLKAEWFPLVITRDDRPVYISALETADSGQLKPLIDFFASRQKRAFIQCLSLSEEVLAKGAQVRQVLESARETIRERLAAQEKDYEQVNKIANALVIGLVQRLRIVAEEVSQIVKESDAAYSSWCANALYGTPNDFYHRYQIIQNARTMGYFANTNSYRAWAAVNIQTNVRTELLFSFHGLGQKPRGILVCAAMAYRREPTETNESRIDDIQPLSNDLFEFTYLDDTEAVKMRFRQWLEDCLVSGLEYWRTEL